MVLGIAGVDYVTGSEVSVSLLYLIPICCCAWYAGRGASVLIAAASAAAWFAAVLLERGLAGQDWVLAWNTLTMGSIFVIVAVLVATLKTTQTNLVTAQTNLEATVVERTAELHETVTALEVEIAKRQRLEREILEISEREQCRLGQDLHDGLGQELAGIAMLGDVHARQLEAEAHPSAAAAADIPNYIRAAIDSARRLAKGLYPIELERSGLLPALKALAAQTSERSGICCELRLSGVVPRLPKPAKIHVFRIVQECISNALKHGRPRCIRIDLQVRDRMHIFAVTDDGIGFDVAAVHRGMGLHLMGCRARVIGAEIVVERPPEGGCRISCRLPIPALATS